MGIFSVLIVVLFSVLRIPLVYANCADVGRQANDSFAAVLTAKDIYKEEIFRTLKKPLSIEGLSAAISSTENMKRVVDDAIVILSQSKAEGCVDEDTHTWATAMAQFRLQSDETAKSRDRLLKVRSEMMDRQPAGQSENQRLAQSGPDMQLSYDNIKVLGDRFRTAATCVAYWRISNKCLPSPAPKRAQEVGSNLDTLIGTVTDRMSELGDAAKLPRADQDLFENAIKESMQRSIGGNCTNFSKLVATYRDKCAAIFQR
jgi:hypothetical protein